MGEKIAAQINPIPGNYRDNFLQGNQLIEEKNYPVALQFFSEAYKVDSTNANIKYKMGVCYLYSYSEKKKALPYLREAVKDVSRNYDPYEPKVKKAPENAMYYLAIAYHYNYQFDSAIMYFESWKAILGDRDPEALKDINQRISWAQNAKEFMANPNPVTITNMGDSINGPNADYSPVVSIDENTLIFTSRRYGERGIDGEFYEDIFISEKKPDGTWTEARPISQYINTPTNDASVSLSSDGNTLFIYRDDNGGDIYQTTFMNGDWMAPIPLDNNINTKYWETHACLSADGNTLYFVSDRPGGFGGRDIYRCVKLGNGQWSKALNLGPTVNTDQDEDAPFIHPDQKTLFFSSKGHKSMGGFDIFFTSKDDSDRWVEPVNLRSPINTPDDDIFYVTSPDGKRAYFSSVRDGGYGEKDIYMATQITPTVQGLTLLKGRIYNSDGSPLTQRVEIDVTNSNTGDISGQYKPNPNGKFTIILPAGATYQISYMVNDKELSNEIIDVPAGSEFEVIDRAINLRDLVIGKLPIDVPVDSLNDSLHHKKPKDWKGELTQTHNLNFSMFFKYNISEIDPNDADFKTFIDSCVAHINKFGEINFRITAAASQVPTKKFSSNKDLATDRATKTQAVIDKALKAKGVDMSKVHWVKVNSYVLGPQYKSDFQKNKALYEKYQYVKVRGY
ncbi:MAG: PD40 domain-containing protein [Bacteroidetes bacterium]|nr:PD40 domain-containing protein [Bacteroidota bacterium]